MAHKLSADEYMEFSRYGVEDGEENEYTFFDIPEVKLCLGFYKHEIKRLQENKSHSKFLVKLARKRIESEYMTLCHKIETLHKTITVVDTDPENDQAVADMNAIGRELAMWCGEIIKLHHLPLPNRAQVIETETLLEKDPTLVDILR